MAANRNREAFPQPSTFEVRVWRHMVQGTDIADSRISRYVLLTQRLLIGLHA